MTAFNETKDKTNNDSHQLADSYMAKSHRVMNLACLGPDLQVSVRSWNKNASLSNVETIKQMVISEC